MALPHSQLQLGTNHALGLHTPNPGGLQRLVLAAVGIVQICADPGEAYFLVDRDVGRPANDLQHLNAGVDPAQAEPVGLRMGPHFQHLADHATGPTPGLNHVTNFDPGHGQPVGQLAGRQVHVHVFSKPA